MYGYDGSAHRAGRAAIAMVCLSAALFGCGGLTGPTSDAGVSFDYSGALDGRFTVQADTPTTSVEGVPVFDDWTLAAASDSLGGVVISGFRVSGPDTGDLFILQLGALQTGAVSCGPNGACHGRILFGIPDHGGLPPASAARHFEIVSGELEVHQADPDRIAGTFSFTARDQRGSGTVELRVEDGAFDLPLSRVNLALSVLCLGARAAGEDCPDPIGD